MKHFILFKYCLLITTFLLIANFQVFAQPEDGENLPQYLFLTFSKSTIKLKNGETRYANLNYNMVSEKMVINQNGQLLNLVVVNVDTVIIMGCKFIPVEDVFYDVAVNMPVALYIQHKSILVDAGNPAPYGTTSQGSSAVVLSKFIAEIGEVNLELPPNYVVRVSKAFWIKENGDMHKFVNEKQFLSIFPAESNLLKKYIKQNKINISDREELKRLVVYCNELIK